MKHETYLSHEEQVSLMHEEEKRSLEDQNLHVRFFALPEINVATNDSYNELRQMKEEVSKAGSSIFHGILPKITNLLNPHKSKFLLDVRN